MNKHPTSNGLLPDGARIAYCIGAQKAGTSWLYECIAQSPECHSLPAKELHYFNVMYANGEKEHLEKRLEQLGSDLNHLVRDKDSSSGVRRRRARKMLDRLSIYATARDDHRPYVEFLLSGYSGQSLLCDFTPAYSVLDQDAFLQMDGIGDARFIFLLRDPVERLWSQIRMANRVKHPDLSDDLYQEKCVAHAQDLCATRDVARIPRANYARTMDALEAAVPRERIRYVFYEDLFTQQSIDNVCAFLGIPSVTFHGDKRINLGRSASLPTEVETMLESALAPQYDAMAKRFGASVPECWRKPSLVSDDGPKTRPSNSRKTGGLIGQARRLGGRILGLART